MRSLFTTDKKIAAGSVTVYLSLMITVILSLILALFQGARVGAAKMKAEIVTEVAMESVLAEYHRELFRRYDLLLNDLSYGTGDSDAAQMEQHLKDYAAMNLQPSTIGTFTDTLDLPLLTCENAEVPVLVRATDGNCAVLRKQILEYMKAEPFTEALSDSISNLEILQANGYDTYDMEAAMDENDRKLDEVLSDNGLTDEEVSTEVAEIRKKRWLSILNLTHPAPSSVSAEAVNPGIYVSGRGAVPGNGYPGGESLSAADLLLLDQYMFEKCAYHGKEKDGAKLKYQIEYIYAGKGDDYSDLEDVAKILLFWREASNFLYIVTDEGKCSTAGTVATIASALLLLPELEEPLKYAILFSWAFAESVADMRALFGGYKVPLVKSADTWQTSFLNMLGFGYGNMCDKGLDYEGYLRMLLLTRDVNTKTARLADIMEMDIRETDGNENFKIDNCIDSFTAHMSFKSKTGFSGTFIRTRGYETKKE